MCGIVGFTGAQEAAPLPSTAVALLASLGTAWLLIGAYVLGEWLREKKKRG